MGFLEIIDKKLMKNFVKRKPYGGQRKINSSRSGVADSPYLQANGNSTDLKETEKIQKINITIILTKQKMLRDKVTTY